MNFPQEYLDVLLILKNKGVPLGDRENLLKELSTGGKIPSGKNGTTNNDEGCNKWILLLWT